MSYILEAIRRSEQERRRRMTPDVSTVHAVRPPHSAWSSRSGHAALAGGVALAVAAAVALQAWPWMTAGEQSAAVATEEGGSPAGETGAKGNAGDAAETGRADPEPATTPLFENAPAGASAAVQDRPPHPPTAEATEAKRPRRPYSSARAERRAESRPKAPEPQAAEMTTGHGQDAAPANAAAEAAPAAEVVSAIALRDLPAPLQRSLPDIAISLHRYAETGAARMIRVNGRIVREGDPVTGDLSVAEITRSGVVFAIGDQRFYMDAFQSWQARGGP